MGSKVKAHWICRLLYVNDVRYFPKGFFPSGNFPRVFFQVETSQMWNFPSGNFPSLSQPQRSALKPILVVALGPHCSLQRLRGPNLTFGNLPLGKLHIWEVATWEIVTWEGALGKMPLEKVPNTVSNYSYKNICSLYGHHGRTSITIISTVKCTSGRTSLIFYKLKTQGINQVFTGIIIILPFAYGL